MSNPNVYQMVTDRILDLLETGVCPWQKPWMMPHYTLPRAGRAYSRSTGKPYSLLNQMLLQKPGEYMTFHQALEAGGCVRKGEKSSMVVFWKMLPIEEVDPKTNKTVKKTIPLLRYYNVFHIDQIDGVEARKFKTDNDETPTAKFDPIRTAETVLHDYALRDGVTIYNDGGARAYYSPSTDTIHLPALAQFKTPAGYYSTAFHEATHSTGHEKRLHRDLTGGFGSDNYGKEELIAEMGAAFLCSLLGLNTETSERNSAAYLDNWIKAIKGNPKMVVSAAGAAEKAVQRIAPTDAPEPDNDNGEKAETPIVAIPDAVPVSSVQPEPAPVLVLNADVSGKLHPLTGLETLIRDLSELNERIDRNQLTVMYDVPTRLDTILDGLKQQLAARISAESSKGSADIYRPLLAFAKHCTQHATNDLLKGAFLTKEGETAVCDGYRLIQTERPLEALPMVDLKGRTPLNTAGILPLGAHHCTPIDMIDPRAIEANYRTTKAAYTGKGFSHLTRLHDTAGNESYFDTRFLLDLLKCAAPERLYSHTYTREQDGNKMTRFHLYTEYRHPRYGLTRGMLLSVNPRLYVSAPGRPIFDA